VPAFMPCICNMWNIKKYLKNMGITQKEFSERMGLSRPTLDAYIEMFENGKTIPKERYEIIFRRLFDSGNDSVAEFFEKLQEAEYLLHRDLNYGTNNLETEAADYVSLIVQNMNKDFKLKNWNEDVYIFINILISNYRKNEIFQQLVEYFIYLNDIRSISEIKERQKPYFANIFKALHSLSVNPCEYDEYDYQNFLNRCSEIREHKKRQNNVYENNIKKRIQNMITEYEKKGIDLSEEEIIEAINNQLIREKMFQGGNE